MTGLVKSTGMTKPTFDYDGHGFEIARRRPFFFGMFPVDAPSSSAFFGLRFFLCVAAIAILQCRPPYIEIAKKQVCIRQTFVAWHLCTCNSAAKQRV